MYKIINIKDRNGTEKVDFYNEMKEIHPNMRGNVLYHEHIRSGVRFCLVWDDDTDQMLRTSTIEEYVDNGDIITITTRNSIYTLGKVGDNDK